MMNLDEKVTEALRNNNLMLAGNRPNSWDFTVDLSDDLSIKPITLRVVNADTLIEEEIAHLMGI